MTTDASLASLAGESTRHTAPSNKHDTLKYRPAQNHHKHLFSHTHTPPLTEYSSVPFLAQENSVHKEYVQGPEF